MEAANLVYNNKFKAIICKEHGYCLRPSRFKDHLNRDHGLKGLKLKAVYEEAAALETLDPLHFPYPPEDQLPIPYLTIEAGYQCNATACNHDTRSISQSWKTVKDHLSKVHNIGGRPGKTQPQATDIREVSLQSFLPKQHYRPFIVPQYRQESSTASPVIQHAAADEEELANTQHAAAEEEESRLRAKTYLQERYQGSQDSWAEIYTRVPIFDNQNIDQIPPWLYATGISNWIGGLGIDKKDLRELIEPTIYGTPNPIDQTVLWCLQKLRQKATPGASLSSIGRVTARILNSFEEDRVQPLHEDSRLRTNYLADNPRINRYLKSIQNALDILETYGVKVLNLDNLSSEYGPSGNETGILEKAIVRSYTEELIQSIRKLSFHLVRARFEESSFNSLI
ncbi:MAG: hypothetical protein Q9167_008067 [Letrouitia subvulpina]